MADKMNKETLKKQAKVWIIDLEYFFSISQKILVRTMSSMGVEDFLKAADEAFNLLDVDGNGTIERGDIE